MKILLLTPPMTQLNTAYPATAYLKGFLKSVGYLKVSQADLSLELALKIFSEEGLKRILNELQQRESKKLSRVVIHFIENSSRYISTIESVVRFLQGKDPTLAHRISSRRFLPEGSRFQAVADLDLAFGSLGVQDQAKYLASLYLDDLTDVVREGVDSKFALSRYAEKLAASEPSFDPLLKTLKSKPTLIDLFLDEITQDLLRCYNPEVVGMSLPFPGNVYGAFRVAQEIKHIKPQTKIIFGGGYVNTELRELSDARVFDFVDFISLDDGEKPFQCILEHLEGKRLKENLLRTFVSENGKVVFKSDPSLHDIPRRETGVPTYAGLKLDSYFSIFELLNPMHRIWSDGRWNKLTLAHGCYWKKCSFCDVSLDYIGRYDPAGVHLLVDRILALIQETGQTGFHFTDEAAPPALLKALATELLERKISISWWGNIRFEKSFTAELTELLARSGCIAVTGGLEVASDRLLKLMNKGVTVPQVARVAQNFSDSGILVHAYLMYGFPTETEEETVESLENVRQLFAAGAIHSAFWHRFSATIHSPIGQNPEKFKIQILEGSKPQALFARNDLPFHDPTGCDHEKLGVILNRALYNFMHGVGLDRDVREWFDSIC